MINVMLSKCNTGNNSMYNACAIQSSTQNNQVSVMTDTDIKNKKINKK